MYFEFTIFVLMKVIVCGSFCSLSKSLLSIIFRLSNSMFLGCVGCVLTVMMILFLLRMWLLLSDCISICCGSMK